MELNFTAFEKDIMRQIANLHYTKYIPIPTIRYLFDLYWASLNLLCPKPFSFAVQMAMTVLKIFLFNLEEVK